MIQKMSPKAVADQYALWRYWKQQVIKIVGGSIIAFGMYAGEPVVSGNPVPAAIAAGVGALGMSALLSGRVYLNPFGDLGNFDVRAWLASFTPWWGRRFEMKEVACIAKRYLTADANDARLKGDSILAKDLNVGITYLCDKNYYSGIFVQGLVVLGAAYYVYDYESKEGWWQKFLDGRAESRARDEAQRREAADRFNEQAEDLSKAVQESEFEVKKFIKNTCDPVNAPRGEDIAKDSAKVVKEYVSKVKLKSFANKILVGAKGEDGVSISIGEVDKEEIVKDIMASYSALHGTRPGALPDPIERAEMNLRDVIERQTTRTFVPLATCSAINDEMLRLPKVATKESIQKTVKILKKTIIGTNVFDQENLKNERDEAVAVLAAAIRTKQKEFKDFLILDQRYQKKFMEMGNVLIKYDTDGSYMKTWESASARNLENLVDLHGLYYDNAFFNNWTKKTAWERATEKYLTEFNNGFTKQEKLSLEQFRTMFEKARPKNIEFEFNKLNSMPNWMTEKRSDLTTTLEGIPSLTKITDWLGKAGEALRTCVDQVSKVKTRSDLQNIPGTLGNYKELIEYKFK